MRIGSKSIRSLMREGINMVAYRIAQVNIGRVKASLDDRLMAGFVNRLDEINRLADTSPGFVWRLQTDAGNATYLRPYEDDRILINMSVWETIEDLRTFVYRTAHAELLRQRQAWFEAFAGTYVALWWIPSGHVPGIDEARQRIAHLEKHGPSQFAFTFKKTFPRDEEFQQSITGPYSGLVPRSETPLT
jgi:Domain of unknown function (DUF3291)